MIEASAGTGKTYTIEHMVVELLLRKHNSARLNEILVLTFTERAAAELRRRIRSKIEEILLQPCREKKCHHDRRRGCLADRRAGTAAIDGESILI